MRRSSLFFCRATGKLEKNLGFLVVRHFPSSRSVFKLAGIATGLLLGVAGTALPGHAAPVTCTFAQINSTGCTLVAGDKTAAKFSAANGTVLPGLGRGWQTNDFLSLDVVGNTWTFVWNFLPSNTNPSPTANQPLRAALVNASFDLDIFDPTKIYQPVFDTVSISRTGTPGIGGLIAGGQAIFTGGPTISTSNVCLTPTICIAGPPSSTFTNPVTSTRVTFNFLAATGTLNTVTLNLTQRPGPPVPGPLPLVGAGIAFGCSRRMRRRIKATA